MLLSAVYVLVVAQSSSEVPEGLVNNPVFTSFECPYIYIYIYSMVYKYIFGSIRSHGSL